MVALDDLILKVSSNPNDWFSVFSRSVEPPWAALLPPAPGGRREAPWPPRTAPGKRRARPRAAPLRSPGRSRPWVLPPPSQRRWLMETKRNKLSATPGARLSPSPEAHFSTWTGSPGIARCREATRPLPSIQGLSGGRPAATRGRSAPPHTKSRRSPHALTPGASPLSHQRPAPSRRLHLPPLAGAHPAAARRPAPPPAPRWSWSAWCGRPRARWRLLPGQEGERGAAASLTWEPFPHTAGGGGRHRATSPSRPRWGRRARSSQSTATGPGASLLYQTLTDGNALSDLRPPGCCSSDPIRQKLPS